MARGTAVPVLEKYATIYSYFFGLFQNGNFVAQWKRGSI